MCVILGLKLCLAPLRWGALQAAVCQGITRPPQRHSSSITLEIAGRQESSIAKMAASGGTALSFKLHFGNPLSDVTKGLVHLYIQAMVIDLLFQTYTHKKYTHNQMTCYLAFIK